MLGITTPITAGLGDVAGTRDVVSPTALFSVPRIAAGARPGADAASRSRSPLVAGGGERAPLDLAQRVSRGGDAGRERRPERGDEIDHRLRHRLVAPILGRCDSPTRLLRAATRDPRSSTSPRLRPRACSGSGVSGCTTAFEA
jgi:hypothetical protein